LAKCPKSEEGITLTYLKDQNKYIFFGGFKSAKLTTKLQELPSKSKNFVYN